MQRANSDPTYNLFGNNCEHFARYVTTGIKESKQLQTAVGLISLGGALLYSILKERKNPKKLRHRKRKKHG